jgi:hypothetical protein
MRAYVRFVLRWPTVLAVLLAAAAAPAAGQLVNPSAAALGFGDNYTAMARGYAATAWNPAALGMPDNPGASFAVLPVQVIGGVGPITLRDLSDWQGRLLPDAVKDEWHQRIVGAGGQKGSAGTDLTYLSLQVGRVGFQASSSARLLSAMGPGAAELLLYGNVGRTGEAGHFTLEGSAFELAAASSVGISYGHPIVRERFRAVALGATLTHTMGHALLSARDRGSVVRSDPLELRIDFPVIHSDTTGDLSALNSGGGTSLDLAGVWEEGPWRLGVVVRNLVDGFTWDEDRLFYRPGIVAADGDETMSDFEAHPFAGAPQAVRDRIDGLGFARSIALGFAYEVDPRVVASADLHRRGESILSGPRTHLGAGVQVSPVEWLPLRLGAAAITGGHLLSAGMGLELGPVHLSLSGATTRSEHGDGSMVMFGLSGGGF